MGRSFSLRNGRRARTTDGTDDTAKQSPCEGCQDRECERTGKPCARVEALLPVERTGQPRRERLVGLDVHGHGRDVRKAIVAYRRQVVDFLRATGKTREAEISERYFLLGHTHTQIAAELGVTRQMVTKIVGRIRRKFDQGGCQTS